MVVSRDQRAGRNHSVKIDSNSFEGVEEFKYLGTTLTLILLRWRIGWAPNNASRWQVGFNSVFKRLTNQNCIQVEVKNRLKLGNACYHSVQKLLSSRLLSKNLKIKIL